MAGGTNSCMSAIFNNYNMKGKGIWALAYPNGGEDVNRNKLLAPLLCFRYEGALRDSS